MHDPASNMRGACGLGSQKTGTFYILEERNAGGATEPLARYLIMADSFPTPRFERHRHEHCYRF